MVFINKEYLDELYYVDYCNDCKTGLQGKFSIPCHHPWYCWETDPDAGRIQYELYQLDLSCASDKEKYDDLMEERSRLVEDNLREWRLMELKQQRSE